MRRSAKGHSWPTRMLTRHDVVPTAGNGTGFQDQSDGRSYGPYQRFGDADVDNRRDLDATEKPTVVDSLDVLFDPSILFGFLTSHIPPVATGRCLRDAKR